jgi:phenylacetate-CoA ligase
VAAVLKRHGEIARARLVVSRAGDSDTMTLKCEVKNDAEGLANAIAASLQEACKLKGAVELVEAGSLPNDGKVIDDQRSYD